MKYSPQLGSINNLFTKHYITGGEKYIIPYSSLMSDSLPSLFRINQDGSTGASVCDLTAGYGKYKIDIYYDSSKGNGWELIETFTMDWSDFDYYNNYPNIFSVSSADVQVQVYSSDSIKVNW